MLNGNRNRCYSIGMWNCRKGLTNRENFPTAKIVDVKDFLMTNDLQLLCLIEADLHGVTSRVRRVKPITRNEIEESLKNRKLQNNPATIMTSPWTSKSCTICKRRYQLQSETTSKREL
jgi:hypothetical protein